MKGEEISNPNKIMANIKSYYMDKYEGKINVYPIECKKFLERSDLPALSDRDCVQQSNQITKQEIYKNLKEMKNNKAPDNNGIH